MDQQITLRISDQLAFRLARAARQTRRKRSEIVRMALEQYLTQQANIKPIDRVRDLVGKYETGIPDLGENHRTYLIQKIKNAR